ncbi:PilZ domain-containing protein [Paenibacillus harenae]|uniref:PilZ domain-containing protein n=1 Tax=Paenibacillus harenae TaxID=306543 RepID=A0ABT9U9V4_PAEHA|nr:PilZ domain-containing protein [Paenibacillus harenae]MDQ0115214.1 hypothetical protein [Paenibacillus harenae]
MSLQVKDYSRAHIRLGFQEGVEAELRLMDKRGQLLSRGVNTVMLMNLSHEGLCFAGSVQLPVQDNYMVDIRMTINQIPIVLRGTIRWNKKHEDGYLHGASFQSSGLLRSLLVRVMNQELLAQQPQQLKIHQSYQRLVHYSNWKRLLGQPALAGGRGH